MNTGITSALAIIPVILFVVAAWPLFFLPRFRPLLLGASGSCCIGVGSTIVALIVSGLTPFTSPRVLADEKQQPAKQQAAESATAEAKPPTAEADPVIDSPRDTVEIPPGRPAWVGSEPNFRGKVHAVAVSSGPYATDAQSKRALDEALVKAMKEYIGEQLGSELAPTLIRFDARTIKKRFLKEENKYHDVARYSDPVGWMHENFALLEFGPDFRNELSSRWEKVRATSRLAQTGLISGGVLLLLTSVFSYFRLDNATRGYYTGRLQFMTAAAILAVVTAGAVISQWMTWL